MSTFQVRTTPTGGVNFFREFHDITKLCFSSSSCTVHPADSSSLGNPANVANLAAAKAATSLLPGNSACDAYELQSIDDAVPGQTCLEGSCPGFVEGCRSITSLDWACPLGSVMLLEFTGTSMGLDISWTRGLVEVIPGTTQCVAGVDKTTCQTGASVFLRSTDENITCQAMVNATTFQECPPPRGSAAFGNCVVSQQCVRNLQISDTDVPSLAPVTTSPTISPTEVPTTAEPIVTVTAAPSTAEPTGSVTAAPASVPATAAPGNGEPTTGEPTISPASSAGGLSKKKVMLSAVCVVLLLWI